MLDKIEIYSVESEGFNKYGRVIKGFDCTELVEKMQGTPLPEGAAVYLASDAELEKLKIFHDLQDREFGGMPIELGYCNGNNYLLNALEYHRSSEINIAATDLVLLVGSLQDVDSKTYAYDTSLVEAFFVSAGSMVELYATTLHFAPCNAEESGFRDAVVLPRGTNLPLASKPSGNFEDKLLFAANKWLIAHPESGLEKDGAFVGLTGKNVSLR